MHRLTYREYKEQTGKNRMKLSSEHGPFNKSVDGEIEEMTGFEVRGNDDPEDPDTERKTSKTILPRSKTLKKTRKYERDIKVNFDDYSKPVSGGSTLVQTSRGQSSIKVDNLFLSLNTQQIRSQLPKFQSLDLGDRRRPVMSEPECPPDRLEFYLTFSTVINLGTSKKKEKEKQNYTRQQSTEQKVFQNELLEVIWLELQAVLRDQSMEDVDNYLLEERERLSAVLDEVMCYRFPDKNADTMDVSEASNPPPGGTIDPVALDITRINKLKTAVSDVSKLISKVELMEGLFPTSKALGLSYSLYNSAEFRKRLDALVLWMNIVMDLFGRACMMSKVLGMHGWPGLGLNCPVIEQERSHERLCGCYSDDDSCNGDDCDDDLNNVQFGGDSIDTTEENSSCPEQQKTLTRPKLQLDGRNFRFMGDSVMSVSEPNSPDLDVDISGATPGACSSTPQPTRRGAPNRASLSGFPGGRHSPNIAVDDTKMHYRHFVEKMLKKMGMKKLLQRLYTLLGHSLMRAMEVLGNPKVAHDQEIASVRIQSVISFV